MSVNVIMPVLGMAQVTGTIVRWLKTPGEHVKKGEPLIVVETDKAVVEIEAPGDGILANVNAGEGDVVPVATVIAEILTPGETRGSDQAEAIHRPTSQPAAFDQSKKVSSAPAEKKLRAVQASPLARRIAEDNHLDLSLVKPKGNRIEKADVVAYLEAKRSSLRGISHGRVPASPKARRMMREKNLDPTQVRGSGPEGAILAADAEGIDSYPIQAPPAAISWIPAREAIQTSPSEDTTISPVGTTWRIMSERTAHSWQTAPHFFLMREVNASQLIHWRQDVQSRLERKVTLTDLLVKVVGKALQRHPRLNAAWENGQIVLYNNINIGLAVAVEAGLVVPVIHRADRLGIGELAAERERLVARAQANSLQMEDISNGTFTVSNLGMYGVDVFNAIINPPQAAILAVGRITDRVVPVDGQAVIRPIMILSLSCDHRVLDGALGAKFLQTVAELIEQPL